MAVEFTERRIQSNGNTVNVNIDRSQPYIDVQKNGQTTRIYGSQQQLADYQNKKPDGTPVATGATDSANVSKGVAAVITGINAQSAINKIKDGKSSVSNDSKKSVGGGGMNFENLVSNPLEQFASYTSLWTLAVLTPAQFNNPTSYRSDNLNFASYTQDITKKTVDKDGSTKDQKVTLQSGIIFSSAGRGNENRVNTLFGSPEYYINNFVMKSIISASEKTGNQNAIGFSFEIYEPFSMGLLLNTMQVGALKAGYVNYLDAPYLLKLDFKGFNETGQIISSMKPKYFVMKFKSVKFDVDESGSKYTVEAFPFNHQGYGDTINTLYKDISLTTEAEGTVEEILVKGKKSLCAILNENQKEMVTTGKYSIPDQFEIQFPKNSDDFIRSRGGPSVTKRATTSNKTQKVVTGSTPSLTKVNFGDNKIGLSKFPFSQVDGGNFAFTKEELGYNETTGIVDKAKLKVDPNKRLFQFSQGQPLTDIIVQIILTSIYAKKAVTDPNQLIDGFIPWFRIDVQIEFLNYDPVIGDFAKKYIYRVVPFLVHHSIFTNPTTGQLGYTQLEKKLTKKYDYIFTGQNNDVLSFEINMNNLFYTGTSPSQEGKTKDKSNQDQGGAAESPGNKTKTNEGPAPEAAAGFFKPKVKRSPALFNIQKGGPGYDDVETVVAKAFNTAVTNSADLIQVDLEILGDTYWLVDSGIANYFAKPSASSNLITEDGSANYEGSDVYIYIRFRTPSDVDVTNGLYKFADGGKDSPFSGIYKVTKCESTFNDGVFKQTLRCLRMKGQKFDYDKPPATSKQTALLTKVGGEQKPQANPSEETQYSYDF